MQLSDISEIVTGLVLTKQLAVNAVNSNQLMGPYDSIVSDYKEGTTELSDLIISHGASAVQAALAAANTVESMDSINWLQVLHETYVRTSAGEELAKFSKRLQSGEDVELEKLHNVVNQLGDNKVTGRRTLAEIVPFDNPFVPIGWLPWDKHIGGMPPAGLVVIGGAPGSGKTSLMSNIAVSFCKMHKEKRAIMYSLEMLGEELKERIMVICPEMEEDIQKRIEINDLPLDVSEVVSDAARAENIGIVFVDFADMLVRGKIDDAQMAYIYVTLSLGAKSLGCPIVLLSQFNRGYRGGIPHPNLLRYTSMAEATANQIVLIYNPAVSFYDETAEENTSSILNDRRLAYLCFWKVRGGFRIHKEDGPGAIGMLFKGDIGWVGEKSKWYSLKGDILS